MKSSVASNIKLSLVENLPLYRREEAVFDEGEPHSLHGIIAYPSAIDPDLVGFFVRKYSTRGDVVLDPFCGSGVVGLNAAMTGRVVFMSDSCPLHVRLSSGMLLPADITEVTLKLGEINTRRPVNLSLYREYFSPYFDSDTYRELVNLKVYLEQKKDRVSRFMEVLALGLLHGQSAGHFSVPTSPHISLTPTEQEGSNLQRKQFPDYRAIIPRLLKRCAAVSRDGIPSALAVGADKHRASVCDARNLKYVPTGAVKLVVTSIPGIGVSLGSRSDQWLRQWFIGMDPTRLSAQVLEDGQAWSMYMNEVLFELARTVQSGGRVCLVVEDPTNVLEDILLEEVLPGLSSYFVAEGVVLPKAKASVIRHVPMHSGSKGIVIKRV